MKKVSIVLSACLCVVGVSALSSGQKNQTQRPFILDQAVFARLKDGSEQLIRVQRKVVNSRGDWKEAGYDVQNTIGVRFAYGFDQYDQTIGATTHAAMSESARRDFVEHLPKNRVREEYLLGTLHTFVLRKGNPGAEISIDSYYAQETGMVPLKRIIRNSNGVEITVEPLSVQFRGRRFDAPVAELPIAVPDLETLTSSLRKVGMMPLAERIEAGAVARH